MRIGIDAHFVGVRRSGNEQYFENLIRALLRQPADGSEYYVFSYRGAAHDRLPGSGVQHVPLASRAVWWQRAVEIPRHVSRLGLDLVHVPFNFLPIMRCRTVVTIHDLGFLRVPEVYARGERLRMRLLTRLAARSADHVVTGSEFARRDIVAEYGLAPERVSVAPSAVDRALFRQLTPAERAASQRRLGLPEAYLLFVGVIQARKNLGVLIDALAALRARSWPELQLLLVGREGFGAEQVFRRARDRAIDGALRHLGVVSDEDLVALYNGARAFVFPSLFEGFGIPILEAMSCGCPVVSSNATSLPEVYGDAALSFDPEDTDVLIARLEEVLSDPAAARRLSERGRERAAGFSWDRTAAIVRRAYAVA
jgi:glycosyltransferase involved in cell wall biosynthesis